VVVDIADVIICANLGEDRFRGFGVAEVKVYRFPLTLIVTLTMPNVMAALSIIGGALCSTSQVRLTPTTRVPCSNAVKMRNPLKFAAVPQTHERISTVSGSKFTIL